MTGQAVALRLAGAAALLCLPVHVLMLVAGGREVSVRPVLMVTAALACALCGRHLVRGSVDAVDRTAMAVSATAMIALHVAWPSTAMPMAVPMPALHEATMRIGLCVGVSELVLLVVAAALDSGRRPATIPILKGHQS